MKIKRIAIAVLASFLVSFSFTFGETHASQPSMGTKGKAYLELLRIAINLQPDSKIIVWIDINATVNGPGHYSLPADPLLYGIKSITLTHAPDIDESNLFWCLTEIQAQSVENLIRIPWVFDITLIRVGSFSQTSISPKLPLGFNEVVDRSLQHKGTLQAVLWMQKSPGLSRRMLRGDDSIPIEVIQNVTAAVEQFGGRRLRDPLEGSHTLFVAIPAESMLQLAASSFVSDIYLNGPVVPEGFDDTERLYGSGKTECRLDLFLSRLTGLESLTALSVAVLSERKTKKRVLTFLTIALVVSLVLVSQKVPSAQALDTSTSAIRATDVWTTGNRGAGINIAVIDVGFDINHPDLAPAIVQRINAHDWTNNVGGNEQHGTHVAGIVAGRGVINPIYRGVAWGAGLVLIKTEVDADLEPAIRWVINNRGQFGISAITMSIRLVNTAPGLDGLESPASIAMDDAVENGIVTIKSAGNIGDRGAETITSPGNAFNIITVGAVNDGDTANISDDTFALYPNGYTYKGVTYPNWGSSRGPTGDGRPKPDVVAPGVHVWSCRAANVPAVDYEDVTPNGFYGEASGTSMATPHVAGTVALMLSANAQTRALTPAQIKAILRQTARLNSDLSGYTANDRGYGIIDAYAAVQLATNASNIMNDYMYDSWEVTTPSRHFDPIGKSGDYLNFAVEPPSSVHGIDVSSVDYHFWDWWGATKVDYRLLWRINAPHVWISNQYYHLGNDMHKYLLSGPRIYEKGPGYALMRALYRVGGVTIKYEWKMHVDEMWLKLTFMGGYWWKALFYIDPEVGGVMNYAYLPSTEETLLVERKIWDPINVDIRSYAREEYVQIEPNSTEVPKMWVLAWPYFGNNPDSALTGQYINNTDIVVYYEAVAYYPDPGPVLHRKHNPPPVLNTTQNDANTGGDAGNTYENATLITPNDAYSGILCSHDPVDTDDWYQFYVAANQTIEVTMNTGAMNELDFDLELYSPNDANNSKASSHLPSGFSENISYVADCSGYWKLRNYIISDEGRYTIYLIVHSSGGPPEPPPGEPIPERIENPDL